MTDSDHQITPEQEAAIERLAEQGENNRYMAEMAVLGYSLAHESTPDESQYELGDGPDESQYDTPEPDDEAPLPDPHRRVSPHHTKPGHVYDFADGGRSDEDRIDYFGEPQTEEAIQVRQDAMPELTERSDDLAQARLMALLGEGFTHAEIQALWEARQRRLGRPSNKDSADN